MRTLWIAAIVLAVASGTADARPKKLDKNVLVYVPLNAMPVDPAEQELRTVKPGDIFAIQKLRAKKSAVTTEELKIGSGAMEWDMWMPAATRLLHAQGKGDREFYCGAVTVGGWEAVLGGKAKLQWICFEDVDKDGRFDQGGYTEPNKGVSLPSFGEVWSLYPVSLGYKIDPDLETATYETAIEYRGTGNLADAMVFKLKVRAPGQEGWSDLTYGAVQGGIVSVSSKDIPKTADINGKKISIAGRQTDVLSIKVESYSTGDVIFHTSKY